MSEYVNLNEAVETVRLTLREIYEKYADEVAKALEQDLRDLPTCELEITGATLLSVDEAENLLTIEERARGLWWWLRLPGNNPNCAAFVSASGYVFALGDFVYYDFGGVRPALQIANLKCSNLEIGDKFCFGNEYFKVISDHLALCESIVGYTRFDAISNDYERSEIKAFVDAWFANAIKGGSDA